MIGALLTETVFLEECIESQTQQQAKYYLLVTNIFDPRRQKQYEYNHLFTDCCFRTIREQISATSLKQLFAKILLKISSC